MSINAIQSLLKTGKGLIETFKPNSEAQRKAAAEMEQLFVDLASESDRMQMELNKIDAMRANGWWAIYRGGWRHAAGWACVLAFIYNIAIYPTFGHRVGFLPIDSEVFETVLYGLLGLGVARTYEKYKGVGRLDGH